MKIYKHNKRATHLYHHLAVASGPCAGMVLLGYNKCNICGNNVLYHGQGPFQDQMGQYNNK
jgi:hypothetical protein